MINKKILTCLVLIACCSLFYACSTENIEDITIEENDVVNVEENSSKFDADGDKSTSDFTLNQEGKNQKGDAKPSKRTFQIKRPKSKGPVVIEENLAGSTPDKN